MEEIVLFKSTDGEVSLPVSTDGDTVWLSQAQMAELFGKNRTVIGKHIKNAIEEGEIDPKVVCANFAHTTRHGAMANRVQHEIVYQLRDGKLMAEVDGHWLPYEDEWEFEQALEAIESME